MDTTRTTRRTMTGPLVRSGERWRQTSSGGGGPSLGSRVHVLSMLYNISPLISSHYIVLLGSLALLFVLVKIDHPGLSPRIGRWGIGGNASEKARVGEHNQESLKQVTLNEILITIQPSTSCHPKNLNPSPLFSVIVYNVGLNLFTLCPPAQSMPSPLMCA